jgi:hypothetical protein
MTRSRTAYGAIALLILPLAACATKAPRPSGFLTSYSGLENKKALRAGMEVRRDPRALAQVSKVAIAEPVIAPGVDVAWMTDKSREAVLREIEAQLCFELSERYEIVEKPGPDAALVRSAVTRVRSTGAAGSAASAIAGVFIPGPIGVRMPGATGGLAAEAEMLRGGRQVAAIIWSRNANTIGTDNPSLSEIGDALQFAEPFGDAVGKTMEPDKAEKRKIDSDNDPCARFGARIRPEGFVAKLATGLYVPELSAAKDPEKAEQKAQEKEAEAEAKAAKKEDEKK